jgi:hypothetical protein
MLAQTEGLLFFVFDRDRLQVLGFYNQTAVETLDIIHAVTPGNNYGTVVLTSELDGLHKAT